MDNSVRNSIITALVHYDGYEKIFEQIKSELKRIDDTMPHATGKDKLAKFEADSKIIFEDAVVPVGSYVFNELLNLALVYLRGTYPIMKA